MTRGPESGGPQGRSSRQSESGAPGRRCASSACSAGGPGRRARAWAARRRNPRSLRGRKPEPRARDVPGRRLRPVPLRTRERARAEAGPAAILPARGGGGRLQGRARTPPGQPGPRLTSRALSRLRARYPEGARRRSAGASWAGRAARPGADTTPRSGCFGGGTAGSARWRARAPGEANRAARAGRREGARQPEGRGGAAEGGREEGTAGLGGHWDWHWYEQQDRPAGRTLRPRPA
jgi:hypothetical protein